MPSVDCVYRTPGAIMTMADQQTSVFVISRSRLEMLVDGVFAIAMTILVLELKVPQLSDIHSVPELDRALVRQAPTFVSYLLSFIVLGMFWYRHNQQYRHYRSISGGMLALHFVMLAAAASFPFCAALVGRYAPNPLAVTIYLTCIVVYAWTATLTWIVARRSGSLSEELPEAAYRRSRKRAIRSSVIVSGLFLINLGRVLGAPSRPDATLRSADDKAIRALAAVPARSGCRRAGVDVRRRRRVVSRRTGAPRRTAGDSGVGIAIEDEPS